MDHTIADKDHLSVRYFFDRFNNVPFLDLKNYLSASNFTTINVHSGMINETHTFSPTFFNDFRLGIAQEASSRGPADGSINAVLSSGDGDVSRTLREYLPYFSEITYSLPMSVASLNQAAFDSLTPELREAVDTAGRMTETELWFALSTRLQQNHERMRELHVTIDSDPPPALMAALQRGAAAAREAWCARSGPACEKTLGVVKTGKP